MTDILSQLRGDIPHRLIEDHWTIDFEALDAEREEAATEIERLREEIDFLRGCCSGMFKDVEALREKVTALEDK